MEQRKILLEKPVWHHPEWSACKNRAAKTGIVLLLIVIPVDIVYLIVQDEFWRSMAIWYWTVYIPIFLFLQWRYGLRFVENTGERLVVKPYFMKPVFKMPWGQIQEVRFEGDWFEVNYRDGEIKKYRFKAAFEYYLDVRELFRKAAEVYSFRIVE